MGKRRHSVRAARVLRFACLHCRTPRHSRRCAYDPPAPSSLPSAQNPEAHTQGDPGLSDRAEYSRDKQREFGAYRWIPPFDTQVGGGAAGWLVGLVMGGRWCAASIGDGCLGSSGALTIRWAVCGQGCCDLNCPTTFSAAAGRAPLRVPARRRAGGDARRRGGAAGGERSGARGYQAKVWAGREQRS